MAEPVLVLKIRGGKPLRGEIAVRGAKNLIPKAAVASVLSADKSILRNVAEVEDTAIVSQIIRLIGGSAGKVSDGVWHWQTVKPALSDPAKFSVVSGKSRTPILFAGPLLHRIGEAYVPALGGCDIGKRPVDFHLMALQKMGAQIEVLKSGFRLRAKRLRGAKIRLPYPSVGATEQVLLTAVLAEGVTELANAAIEPEIIELIAILQKMGAIISVDVDRLLTIVGVEQLSGFDHSVMTDRLEVASWAVVAAATGGEIFVRHARQIDLMTFLNKFRQIGGMFSVQKQGISFWRGPELKAIALETDVHPGFMTDWQQPFTVLLTQARGASVVHETVYENRFGYVQTLQKMGAQIELHRECLGGKKCRFGRMNYLHSAVVIGPTRLRGAEITVPDLRAGFSYVVAALAADGVSVIKNMRVISRGYERFLEKLTSLGADYDY